MGKFKIGDRVRVLPRDKALAFSRHGATAGKEYTVKAVSGGGVDYIDTELWSFFDHEIELIPTLTIKPGKHYRTRSGKPTGRVTVGDTGFEAVVDGKVRIYDAAGGHVHGDADLDIVEAWVPRVGERVRYKNRELGEATVLEVDGENHIKVDTHGPYKICTEILSDLEPLPVAPQPAAPALKIEAGRYYKTRDGRKVGPMVNEWWHDNEPWTAPGYGYCSDSGKWNTMSAAPDSDDLIAEWPTAQSNVGAQVDTLAEEYGPAQQQEPDTTPHIKFTSDFSELDAAILVRKKKLKKLIKLARKAGIELREAA